MEQVERTFREHNSIERAQLFALYEDAGWKAYTKEPAKLFQAIGNSLYVLSVWEGEELVGLLRAVGDGLTIVYIQDILVLRKFKRKGIGTSLMRKAIEKFKGVRQKVLLTEDTEVTRRFYESLGFESCDKGNLVAFVEGRG